MIGMKRYLIFFLLTIFLTSIVWSYIIYEDDPPGIEIGEYKSVKAFGDPNRWPSKTTDDLCYQCVEYVKRFYFCTRNKKLGSVGSAKNAMNAWQDNFEVNENGHTKNRPKPDDIIVFDGGSVGHVAIVTKCSENTVEFIQQNWPGKPFGSIKYTVDNNGYVCCNNYSSYIILGWLTDGSGIETEYKDFKPEKEFPKGGSKDVDPKIIACVKFNQDVNPDEVTNFAIVEKVSVNWPRTENYNVYSNADKIYSECKEGWQSEATYKITIKKGLKSKSGSELKEYFSYQFTIKKAPPFNLWKWLDKWLMTQLKNFLKAFENFLRENMPPM
jgi:surface antigen